MRVGPLTAEITAASAERLGLKEGEVVVAAFKATATRLTPSLLDEPIDDRAHGDQQYPEGADTRPIC